VLLTLLLCQTINYFASKGKVKKGPVSERLLGARLEFSFVEHGGEAHAYPPVVAGGHRGTTIHYVSNSKSIEYAKPPLPGGSHFICWQGG